MEPDHAELSDAQLLTRIRAGDAAAMGLLYARHREAGLAVARAVTGDPHLAEDLVASAFERIQGAISRGRGPDDSFRAYLYTVIRRLAVEHGQRRSREDDVDDWEPYEAATALADQTDGSVEAQLVSRAFATLPERHQAVLWYLDVEGMAPAQAAPLFGLTPNAVSALAVRARDALRDAYVQAHVADGPAQADCAPTRRMMGAYLRGTLSKRDRTKVDAHLEGCEECPVVLAELRDVAGGLRSVFGPILIGGLALGAGAGAVLLGGAQPAAAAVGAAAKLLRPRASLAQLGAGAAVAAVGALVVVAAGSAITSGGGAPAQAAPPAATSAPTTPSAAPSPDPTPPAPSPTSPPSSPPTEPSAPAAPPVPPKPPAPSPSPSPSATPPATAALDTDLVDDGDDGTGTGDRLGTFSVEVRNTDTGAIVATLLVTLPTGVRFDAARSITADTAWVCTPPLLGRLSCLATALAPGADLAISIPIVIDADHPGARPSANLSISS